ncbi:MAG: adenylate kinase family enzyme [Paraglaciecola sp.]
MRKIAIFGNSGSGKSTLAKKLANENRLAHLDLDTLAWLPTSPPERKTIPESKAEIEQFIKTNKDWVIEGCYADLLAIILTYSTEIIFMDLPIEDCVENAKNRPWEPHKYVSKDAQDDNLAMLIEWVMQYNKRRDTFSQNAHRAIFDGYKGKKSRLTCNP